MARLKKMIFLPKPRIGVALIEGRGGLTKTVLNGSCTQHRGRTTGTSDRLPAKSTASTPSMVTASSQQLWLLTPTPMGVGVSIGTSSCSPVDKCWE